MPTMTITLTLPPATEEQLRAQAAARGQEVADFVRELVEQSLGTQQPSSTLTPEQRAAAWRSWVAAHSVPGVVADDSRESMY
jgi:hypothetical protein